jgi:glycosyltransferase involved in cell wall biosynthesis
MKVIFAGSFNESGIMAGPEKVSKRIFEEYSKIDKTLFVCYFQDGKKYSYIKKLFGCKKITSVNGSQVIMFGIIRMLFEILKLKPKFIHIPCFDRFTVFLYLLRLISKVKIFYTLNGIVRHENKYFIKESQFTVLKNRIVEKIIIYASDRIFYLSEFSKKMLFMYYSPDVSRLSKATNGLDDCFLDFAKKHHTKKDDNTIVFIGNIDREDKGFRFLFEALSKFEFKTKLFIIDSADKSDRFKSLPNLNISVTDKMIPSEMVEYFMDKRIIVSASKYDQFPISILEAISCGLYPILTRQTGLSEIMGDYLSISTFDYGDEKSFLDILTKLFNGNLTYQLKTDLEQLSWKNIFEKYYLSFYL